MQILSPHPPDLLNQNLQYPQMIHMHSRVRYSFRGSFYKLEFLNQVGFTYPLPHLINKCSRARIRSHLLHLVPLQPSQFQGSVYSKYFEYEDSTLFGHVQPATRRSCLPPCFSIFLSFVFCLPIYSTDNFTVNLKCNILEDSTKLFEEFVYYLHNK